MVLKELKAFIEIARKGPDKKIAVAAAEDQPVLEAVAAAKKEGIAHPILVGNKKQIEAIAKKINFELKGVEILDEADPAKASKKAVQLVRGKNAQILMKGLVGTADYLRAILDKENGLRKGSLLSHVGFFETGFYPKLLAVTDAAQNIAPDLMEKKAIIENAVDMLTRLGYENPKVACVAAVENVNPKMQATMDAANLAMMNRRKQIKGCIVDGPLGFDNAISKEAAEHKGIISEVAGDADLVMGSNIEVANVLYKSLTYFAGATVASITLGATVPVVLTSRADSDKSKLMSIALAASY